MQRDELIAKIMELNEYHSDQQRANWYTYLVDASDYELIKLFQLFSRTR